MLGMMLVGLGLSQIKSASIDYMFSGLAFVAKFLIWPIVIMGIIFIDSRWLNFYDASIYQIMFLMSIVPLASNTVAFAAKFNLFPEKSAFTVLISPSVLPVDFLHLLLVLLVYYLCHLLRLVRTSYLRLS